ncbi:MULTISPECIES: bifunctional phosphopantothenoylcysteine decarboxylase/phosphopantothenate--cysteine ligase CoaBC [unclassified Halomonas]|uniref:bifunctional phosphopantothenoylcysteine decarboxylase/phosphopantothenate--cysteine ligase CoaBC n=1 Tax=Halomonas sp. N3-2A TaxID=2014541 RepID=UPI000B5B42B0|nr:MULTISPECIES: bifunctional phosphopantothenoylcysteine decarboxylase/phosphopantothenate--cysteine ligase CoaBC [unclassified Halomonas]ASK21875.1 bifunctional 4'-phosphopantothenoylcysteine decarboxylase/phosphopantothenoylcysteine synthetase [Halomonas sp. N3-2A]UTD57473.1 bifunctional phosphopantothenoylcysteine decarboxylase/phosphopantothenate--cysteine ligase CoaBC [Halomonas sp. MS1]
MALLSPSPLTSLAGKRLLLGISAGIAAYKSALIVRLLKQAGCEVRVVMTEGAQAFITPLTLQALSGEPVRTSLLDPEAEAGMGHIELARWADAVLIAPATADLIARLVHGMADDLLTTLCLACEAPKLIAPAMNQAMWRHPATQRNVSQLANDGWQLIGPAAGDQACGDVGPGRMSEPEVIVDFLAQHFASAAKSPAPAPAPASASAPHVVITAGPTREALDPVRYLSNHSSGKMGYALAAEAAAQGARVTLISGPVNLPTPHGVERIDVETAAQMHHEALTLAPHAGLFIGCAAVADYRAASAAEHKIKKTDDSDTLTLTLVKNPDIIADVSALPTDQRPFVVGFAAETQDVARYAEDKLTRKGLDMIVANDVSQQGLGFGSDNNAALLLWRSATGTHQQEAPPQPKTQLAALIIRHALSLLPSQRSSQPPSQLPSQSSGELS